MRFSTPWCGTVMVSDAVNAPANLQDGFNGPVCRRSFETAWRGGKARTKKGRPTKRTRVPLERHPLGLRPTSPTSSPPDRPIACRGVAPVA